jgi:hypothetical protein
MSELADLLPKLDRRIRDAPADIQARGQFVIVALKARRILPAPLWEAVRHDLAEIESALSPVTGTDQ